MELTINLESHKEYTLLTLEGGVGSSNLQTLENALKDATHYQVCHIAINCAQLNSLNSDALRLLMYYQVELAGKFYLSMYNVSDDIASLLELSGISYFMQIHRPTEKPS